MTMIMFTNNSNKCYTRGKKGRQDLQFSSVLLELLYSQSSKGGLELPSSSETMSTFLFLLWTTTCSQICVSVKRKTLAFQLWYIMFYPVLFLHRSLHYICYSSSTIGDFNISVSYPWADIHCKYAARFHKDIL